MLDYLVDKLESSEDLVQPVSKELNGIKTNYILFGQDRTDGILVLVDKKFTKGKFNNLDSSITYAKTKEGEKRFNRANYIFMKDGTNFFRSAAKDNRFKSNKDLSLKYYSNGDINNMILMSPVEILSKDKKFGYVQYYQPESSRLEEGVLTCSFSNVEFDYSHIENNRFKPTNKDSKRLFLANFERFDNCDLKLNDKGFVLDRNYRNENS